MSDEKTILTKEEVLVIIEVDKLARVEAEQILTDITIELINPTPTGAQ